MSPNNDSALILSGGGARGAYQAGAIRALYEICATTGNFSIFRNLVGVSAGASAPDVLVQDLVARLQELKDVQVELMAGVEENVRFRLPPELADQPAAAQ